MGEAGEGEEEINQGEMETCDYSFVVLVVRWAGGECTGYLFTSEVKKTRINGWAEESEGYSISMLDNNNNNLHQR